MVANEGILENPDQPRGPMSDAELASVINNELSVALGSSQDDINSQQATALNYYFGRIPGEFLPNTDPATTLTGISRATEGNSNAVSLDVADMVEAMLAQIMPTFAQDTVAEFEALGPDDEKRAAIESRFVNYHIMQKCDGYVVFNEAIKNALLLKNGIIKVYVDEYQKVTLRDYDELSEIDFETAAVLADENTELFREEREDGRVCVKQVKKHKRLCVEAVDNTNFRIKTDQRSQKIMDDCLFCAERKVVTQTWLLERGVDPEIVAALPEESTDTDVNEIARNQSQEENEHYYYEASTKPIEIWECYLRVDYDRDGYGELRRVVIAGDKGGGGGGQTIIENTPVDWIPYATGAPFLNPGRWLGISLFDKVKEIQDQKTDTLRQYINNNRYHNNRRLEVDKASVNLDDAVNSRPGGIIRSLRIGSVREIPVTDIGPSCMNLLNYLDKMRTERGGASLDMQTEGITVGGDTAHGVERQMSFKEMLASMVTKTLAETLIKNTYLLVHRTLREYFDAPLQARIGEDWQSITPAEWPEREHVSINVGMSPGERARQSAALREVLGIQQQAMEGGKEGIFTDISRIYNAATDLARMNGLDNVGAYYIDPESQGAIMAAQQAQQRANQQAQAQMQAQQQQFQAMMQLEMAKLMQQVEESIRDHEVKIAQMLLDSETKEAELTGDTQQLNEQQNQIRNAAAVSRLARQPSA